MILTKIVIALLAFSFGWVPSVAETSLQKRLSEQLAIAHDRHELFGQSVAVLQDGKLIFAEATGEANVEFGVSAEPGTVYSIYSVTKLFVSVRLLRLVEEGQLNLQDPIGSIVGGLPEAWQDVTILQLLSHVSGLPEYSQETMLHLSAEEAISAVFETEFEFEPGSASSYNQTNFFLLQRVLETLEGKAFSRLIEEDIVRPLVLEQTSLGGEFDIIDGRATRYERSEYGIKRVMRNDPPDYYYAANGLNSSVLDTAHWFEALLTGELIELSLLHQAWQPIQLNNGKTARHTHGWEYRTMKGYTVVGHYGSNIVNVRHFFRASHPEKSVTVIHFTNGRRKPFDMVDFSYALASEVWPDMQTPLRSLKQVMINQIEAENWPAAEAAYQAYSHTDDFDSSAAEEMVNRLGYEVMSLMSARKAIPVFELNKTEHPTSANAHDSLAEAFQRDGQFEAAIASYREALRLDPENERIQSTIAGLSELNIE